MTELEQACREMSERLDIWEYGDGWRVAMTIPYHGVHLTGTKGPCPTKQDALVEIHQWALNRKHDA